MGVVAGGATLGLGRAGRSNDADVLTVARRHASWCRGGARLGGEAADFWRLTTRGLCRPRLRSAGTVVISIRTSSTMRRRRRRGKRGMERQVPADEHWTGVDEGQRVGVAAGVAAGVVDQPPAGRNAPGAGHRQSIARPDRRGGCAASAAAPAGSPSANFWHCYSPSVRDTRPPARPPGPRPGRATW